MISMVTGKGLAYSLFNLQERGRLFIAHGRWKSTKAWSSAYTAAATI